MKPFVSASRLGPTGRQAEEEKRRLRQTSRDDKTQVSVTLQTKSQGNQLEELPLRHQTHAASSTDAFTSHLPVVSQVSKPVSTSPGPSASANLRAALAYQESEEDEVRTFLTANGLFRYIDVFIGNGFDCMEVVEVMEEQHMKDLGMVTGHIIKLQKRLATRKSARSRELPRLSQSSHQPPDTIQKRHSAEQLCWTGVESADHFSQPQLKSSLKSKPEAFHGSLLEGDYDEQAAADSFREAVQAWRQQDQKEHEVAASQNVTSSLPSSKDSDALSMAAANALPELTDKKCCYQCYKQFFVRSGLAQRFCSETCESLAEEAKAKRAAQIEQRKQTERLKLEQQTAEHNAQS